MRSPFGSGVSDARMVSPMPSCSSTESAAVVATMPFDAEAGFGQSEVQRDNRTRAASVR